jgi:hypothetical protein
MCNEHMQGKLGQFRSVLIVANEFDELALEDNST